MRTKEHAVRTPGEAERPAKRAKNPRRRLLVRRLLAVAIILAFAGAVGYVVFRTDLLAPVLTVIPPIQNFIAWCIEDPRRAWGACAAFFMSNLGLYALIEEHVR